MWTEIDKRFADITGAPVGETYKKNTWKASPWPRRNAGRWQAWSLIWQAGLDYVTGQSILIDGGIVYR